MEKEESTKGISKWLILCVEMMKDDPPDVIVLSDAIRKYCEIVIQRSGTFRGISAGFNRLSIEKWPEDLRKKALLKALEFFEKEAKRRKESHLIENFESDERDFLIKYLLPNSGLFRERIERVFKNLISWADRDSLCWMVDHLPTEFEDVKILTVERQLTCSWGDFNVIFDGLKRLKTFPKISQSMEELRDRCIQRLLTNPRSWLPEVFAEFEFPINQKLEIIKKAFANHKEMIAFLILRYIPGMPEDLQEEYFDHLHSVEKPKNITAPALNIIEKICGKRYIILTKEILSKLTDKIDRIDDDFQRINEVPLFPDREWFLKDTEEKMIAGEIITTGALLCLIQAGDTQRRVQQLILLRDSSAQKSYVYRADPRAKTVEEAIAYGYQLDPEKFKGFIVEK